MLKPVDLISDADDSVLSVQLENVVLKLCSMLR